MSSAELSEVQPSKLRLLSIPDYFANYKGSTTDLAPFLGATISAKVSGRAPVWLVRVADLADIAGGCRVEHLQDPVQRVGSRCDLYFERRGEAVREWWIEHVTCYVIIFLGFTKTCYISLPSFVPLDPILSCLY